MNNLTRPFGILFYTLRGSPGWSNLGLVEVDVARVIKSEVRKRWCRIFDRDLPYVLDLEYYLPKIDTRVLQVPDGRGGYNMTYYKQTILQQTISKRYQTRAMAIEDQTAIRIKQSKLDKYANKLRRQLENE